MNSLPLTRPAALFLTCTLGLASNAALAANPALEDAANFAGVSMWLNSGAPGLLIAVVNGDDTFIEGYGETKRGNGIAPDEKTIVHVGSVSKVFAADLLSAMVANHTVALADPLSKYAPKGVTIPSVDGRTITLLDLATHGAGLPREISDPTPGNPFSGYSAKTYWDWFGTHKLAYQPGTTAMYSNFGYGLLGEALAQAGGKPFASLLQQYVTGPLGLTDTVTRLSEEQRKRMMTGTDIDGSEAQDWEIPPVMDASASVYSTAHDMVRWMRWHLANDAAGMETRDIVHAMYRPHDGLKRLVGVEATQAQGMGLGWVVSMPQGATPFILGKSGGLSGFMNYVVLSPNRRIGVWVAVNRVNFAMFEGIHSTVFDLVASLSPR